MKWYKYWKIYLGIGAFFLLSIISSVSLKGIGIGVIPNIILTAIFLFLGAFGKKKAFLDENLIAEIKQKQWNKLNHLEKYKNLEQIKTKIVGVTFKNNDGSSRQKALSKIKNNEQLYLKEYTYKGEPAYYVMDRKNNCLGNLPEHIARRIKREHENNGKLVFVEDCYCFDRNTSNDDQDLIYGCKIIIYIK